MEKADEKALHYAMLEYIFNGNELSKSCFNYTWHYFKEKKISKFIGELTSLQLKTIFCTQILPNIHQYNLLSIEQKKYFSSDEITFLDLENEDLIRTLERNEVEEVNDYDCWKSTKEFRDKQPVQDQRQQRNIIEILKNPNLSDDNDDIKIHILEQDISSINIENININDQDPTKFLNRLLMTDAEVANKMTKLTDEEMLNRLMNENVASDFDYLRKSTELHKFFEKYPVFKEILSDNEEDEDVDREISQDSSVILGEKIAQRSSRSQSSYLSMSLSSQQKSAPLRLSMSETQRSTLGNKSNISAPRVMTRATRKKAILVPKPDQI